MITQTTPVVSLDKEDREIYRAVGEIDNDGIFFAYTERFDPSVNDWEYDCVTQYQRDCVIVPNLEHDPDFLYWLGYVAGFAKPDESELEDPLALLKRHQTETCLNGCGSH